VSTLLARRGVQVNTLNAGRAGNTIHDALNVLLNHVVMDRPDLVVLMEATNDIGVQVADADSYRSRMEQPLGVGIGARALLHTASTLSPLAALVRKGIAAPFRPAPGGFREPPHRRTPPPEGYEARLRAFLGIARGFGIVPVLMTQPLATMRNAMTPEWADQTAQDVYNDVVRRVARSEQVALIDLANHIANAVPAWNEPNRIFYDGMHVNDAGAAVYAEFISTQMLEQRLLGPRTSALVPP
jgi:lysophospholipase L1-like esterase